VEGRPKPPEFRKRAQDLIAHNRRRAATGGGKYTDELEDGTRASSKAYRQQQLEKVKGGAVSGSREGDFTRRNIHLSELSNVIVPAQPVAPVDPGVEVSGIGRDEKRGREIRRNKRAKAEAAKKRRGASQQAAQAAAASNTAAQLSDAAKARGERGARGEAGPTQGPGRGRRQGRGQGGRGQRAAPGGAGKKPAPRKDAAAAAAAAGPLKGSVVSSNAGGLVVEAGGVTGFLPLSKFADRRRGTVVAGVVEELGGPVARDGGSDPRAREAMRKVMAAMEGDALEVEVGERVKGKEGKETIFFVEAGGALN